MNPHSVAGTRFDSTSVIARGCGCVVQMLCAPASFRAICVSRAPQAQICRHMLKFARTMPPRGGVVGGINFDVNYSHIGSVYCRTTFESDLHLISIFCLAQPIRYLLRG